MANRFWVGDGGNWSDALNHWSASTGGAANASKPTSADNVFFDANSFTIGAQTVTVDETANCLAMDWTGVTNTPTFAMAATLNCFGSALFVSGMSHSASSSIFTFTDNAANFTTAQNFPHAVKTQNNATLTLLDDLIMSSFILTIDTANLNTNGKTLSCTTFRTLGAGSQTITLGASTVNCTAWTVSNLTLNANTSTIKVTGTGAFSGAGKTYNNVELNGSAHTISGSNTFAQLSFKRNGIQTITFTDGTTQTVTNMFRPNDTNVKTLVGTSTAGWNLTKQGGGRVDLDYLALSYSAATADKFYAGANSTDTTGNTGWVFRATPKVGIAPGSSAKIAIAPGSSAKIAVS